MTTSSDPRPGDPITWTHFYPDGRKVERTGTVIDRAPVINATRFTSAQLVNWWVMPDEPLASDLYKIIAVGKAGGRSTAVHGRYLDDAGSTQFTAKGSLFSSNYAGSPTGGLAAQAVQKIHGWKKAA